MCFINLTIVGSKSFQFPTYHPLLLIRVGIMLYDLFIFSSKFILLYLSKDPPGGDSYVSYENVQSTIHIRQTSMESYIGFEVR